MSFTNVEESLLFIVDVQEKLLNAVFNKEKLLHKAEILSKVSSILSLPTIITEQYPKGLGNTVDAVKNNLSETAKYFEKNSFNALSDEQLFSYIKSLGKKQVLIFGIETHICVYQTAIALLDAGFEVTIIKDACGSRSQEEYLAAFEIMSQMGIKIKTTEMIIFELLKTSKHQKFKDIQALIK